jgi:magnesium transporter
MEIKGTIYEAPFLDTYAEDLLGSRASTSFVSVTREFSVKEVMKALVVSAAETDNVSTVFVTETDGRFIGAIGLKRLILARSTDMLENIIDREYPFVYDTDIISDSVERIRSFTEELIPVLSVDNRILGVITSSEVIDILDDEFGDDYAKFAALSEEEERGETIFSGMKKRIPWLIALLFMGLLVSATVGLFGGVVKALPFIVSFQSLILGMAGNVGTQSLAVTVRALGSGEEYGFKERWRMIARETRIALLNGIVLGAVAFVIVFVSLCLLGGGGLTFSLTASCCVGIAMSFSMMLSGFTGAAIPLALYHFGADPAVASGPLITTVNDLAAVVSYYGLAWLLLLKIAV